MRILFITILLCLVLIGGNATFIHPEWDTARSLTTQPFTIPTTQPSEFNNKQLTKMVLKMRIEMLDMQTEIWKLKMQLETLKMFTPRSNSVDPRKL